MTINSGIPKISRRDFLKLAGASASGALLTGLLQDEVLAGSVPDIPINEYRALLYDATICVGCKACEIGCRDDNHLPIEPTDDLTGNTFTLIKEYSSEDGSERSFRKFQCMHCVDPACASSCPVSSLHQSEDGSVVYDAYKCIGCRYCMQACPFGVPRYDWSLAYPMIRKCDFCYDREDGPACAITCPTGALISGKRGELLSIAKQRIAAEPGKYFEDRIFGEYEGGGTSVLILSAVSFNKLGFPPLDKNPLPNHTQWALNIVPAIFFGVGGTMAAIYKFRSNQTGKQEEMEPQE